MRLALQPLEGVSPPRPASILPIATSIVPNPLGTSVAAVARKRSGQRSPAAPQAVLPPALIVSGACLRGRSLRPADGKPLIKWHVGKLCRLAKYCRLCGLQLFFRAYRLYRKRAK
jgi:hypothetical protein